ncbi:21917_t:CDS:1, partial [Gigaspora margarita]
KEYINKRIYKDKKGMMYCKPLDDYWRTENLDLVHIHVNDIEELGKRVCDKCNKRKFCCVNSIVNNNCCGIESCLSMNVINPPIDGHLNN